MVAGAAITNGLLLAVTFAVGLSMLCPMWAHAGRSPHGDPGLELVKGPAAGDCRVYLIPEDFTGGASPVRLVLAPGPTGGLVLDMQDRQSFDSVQLVVGDSRQEFTPFSGDSVIGLTSSAPWLSRADATGFHLTAKTRSGQYRTSSYKGISPMAAADLMEEACGLVFERDRANATCEEKVRRAYKEGAQQVEAHLQLCADEAETLEAGLSGCRTPDRVPDAETLTEGIRRLLSLAAAADIAPAAVADPLDGLAQLEKALAASPGRHARVAKDMRAHRQLLEAQEEIDVLLARRQVLEKRRKDRVPDAVAKPASPMTSGQLEKLVEGLMAPSECDDIAVTVTKGRAITVSGVAASAAAEEMRGRFEPFRRLFAKARFDVGRVPGGTCNVSLGGGWWAIPEPGGKIERTATPPDLAELPSAEECRELTPYAASHPDLGPYFEPGRTPLVWCRRDPDLGVCKRDAYSGEWYFQRNEHGKYTGFPIMLLPDR